MNGRIAKLIRGLLKLVRRRPSFSTCRVEPISALVLLTAGLVAYSTYSTIRTGAEGALEMGHTDQAVAAMQKLPDKWRDEAYRRWDRGEISGYEREIEYARAEAMRARTAEIARKLHEMGDRNAKRFMASGFLQAVTSLSLSAVSGVIIKEASSSGIKILSGVPPDRVPTLGPRITDAAREFFRRGVIAGAAEATGQAGLDLSLGQVIDLLQSPRYRVRDAYVDRVRGLERLRKQIGAADAGNDLMAAHWMSLVMKLEKLRREDPQTYEARLAERAERYDSLMQLSEERQRAGNRRVASRWQTTADFRRWLHEQVVAKQAAEQRAREEAAVSAALVPSFKVYPPQGKAPLQVRFDAGATRGDVQSFHWDFGNDYTAEGLIVAHVYKASGEYDVTLTVTGADGQTQSTTRRVTVVPGEEGEVSVDVSASPSQAQPGGKLTVVVQPKVTGVEEGDLTVEVAIDGRRIYSDSHSGALDGNLSRTVQYDLPKDIAAGNHQVRATAQLRTDPEAEPVAALDTATFRIEGETSGLDAFLGRWTGQVTLPTIPPSKASMTLNITQVDESHIRVSINSPHPSATPRSDVYKVTGNSAVFRRNWFEKQGGYEHFEEIKFLVVGDGKILTGSSLERVFDPGPPREELGTYSGAFHTVRVQGE